MVLAALKVIDYDIWKEYDSPEDPDEAEHSLQQAVSAALNADVEPLTGR